MTRITVMVCLLLAIAGMVQAQTGATTLSVAIGPEAALTVTTGTTNLSSTSTAFGNPFTGTTSLQYYIRTTKSTGTGTLTTKVTTDFGPAGGPSVATPPSTGDALTYACTVSAPGTACTGSQTASTAAQVAFGSWGAGANSAKGGNSASVAWSLSDDPVYATGAYSATVTFTISAT